MASSKTTRQGGGKNPFLTLRWTFRLHYREEVARRQRVYCHELKRSEPDFDFSAYALTVSQLPENAALADSVWSTKLSDEAQAFLKELEFLHESNALAALKIAAIVAGSTSQYYCLIKAASERVLRWLGVEDASLQGRIQAGVLIRTFWPDELNKMEGLEKVLLELLVALSSSHPELAWQMVQRVTAKWGKRSPLVFSFDDNPADKLALGMNLVRQSPDFCKTMMGTYLFSHRYPSQDFTVSETDARRVADALFELETRVPSPSVDTAAGTYADLIKRGFPDAAWYGQALARSYELACLTTKPALKVGRLVMVMVHAPIPSPLHTSALLGYEEWAQGYARLPLDERRAVLDFVELLLDTLPVVCHDASFDRNASLAANRHHPVVEVSVKAYWGLVDSLLERPSPLAAAVLVEAVMRKDLDLAEQAATRLTEVYESQAKLNVLEGERTLFRLARRTLNSDINEPLKARCLALFQHLHPVLNSVDPEAAVRSREGLHEPDIF